MKKVKGLDFPITGDGPLSFAARALGIESFAQAAEIIRELPYGRINCTENPIAVLHEHKGTCSSKHQFLAKLALECGHTDVLLTLGLYKMSELNTPGIGRALAAAKMKAIPEAHCYITYQNHRYDYTGLTRGKASPFNALIEERTISPDSLPSIKLQYHQRAIAQWAATVGLTFERAWQLREDCIASLVNA